MTAGLAKDLLVVATRRFGGHVLFYGCLGARNWIREISGCQQP